MIGRVTAVKEERLGTELASDASLGDDELDLVDPDELDLDGGELKIGDETHAYTVTDGVVTLADTLDAGYDAEEPVVMYPATLERVAYLLGPGQEQELEARVPHQLYDRVPVGIREDDASAEFLEVALIDGEYVVTDVLGREPGNDVGFLFGFEMNGGTVNIDTAPSPTVQSDPIEHGLSQQPTGILLTANYQVGKGTARVICTYGDVDEDTFRVKIRSSDSTINLSAGSGDPHIRVAWMAFYIDRMVGRVDREPSGGTDSTGTASTD